MQAIGSNVIDKEISSRAQIKNKCGRSVAADHPLSANPGKEKTSSHKRAESLAIGQHGASAADVDPSLSLVFHNSETFERRTTVRRTRSLCLRGMQC